ncbi:MAG: dihydrolipoyl dehydrogenase [Marinobacter sp.]|uniref:dihydrolipoyl dehydrogenase n=1 Tax=Marinobacter sp. TaxID=50741 RepID=UPI00299DF03C|nr:dihydrolipoyl dehydrogenase [Marinobacter sp.]MDX1634943.1 dihydrolipoyl dehydrogenase [Marinobacter sp.]
MEKRNVDVAIIGTGTAGMVAYKAARAHTDRIAVIEGGEYGTTCARVGCMPSKLLIAAAEAAHDMKAAELFGVHAGDIRIDGRAVMERVRRERDRFVSFVLESVESFPEQHRVSGYARFIDPHTLRVDDNLEIEAERIVIATGSRPSVPDFLRAAGDRLIVNDDVFNFDDLPSSVAVFGPGLIGLELGQALSRLGVRVHMFGVSGDLGPVKDAGIRDYALKTFRQEFRLDPDAKVSKVERTDDGVAVTYEDPERGTVTDTFDYLLAATGRRPNIDKLDIQNADIELDERGVPRFNPYTMQCSARHIFIAGDVNAELPLLHEATDEGRIAGNNAGAGHEPRVGLRRTPLSVVFTSPQIATVGMSIDEVDERCRGCFEVGEVSFEGQGRSRVIGKNQGILRVYGEQGSGLLMGAEMFGPAAEHIGHLLAWAVQKRMTVSEVLEMPFYHPVIEEGVRTALRDLNHKLNIEPEMVDRCLECGPGA